MTESIVGDHGHMPRKAAVVLPTVQQTIASGDHVASCMCRLWVSRGTENPFDWFQLVSTVQRVICCETHLDVVTVGLWDALSNAIVGE